MYERMRHVRNAEVRETGKRIKVFKLDESIDKERFGLLAITFMVWNHNVLTTLPEPLERKNKY